MGMGFGTIPWGELVNNNNDVWKTGDVTKQKNLSQEAVDKIMYDVLSSDQGLAALSSGENTSGGFGSSTKTLMAQDMAVKLAGEIANITAEETVTNNTRDKKRTSLEKNITKTVICTALLELGMLSQELYTAGHTHFSQLPARTVIGYHFWAEPIVPLIKKYKLLARIAAHVATKRYEYIVHGKKSLTGLSTVYIGQPISYAIGFLIGVPNGRYITA